MTDGSCPSGRSAQRLPSGGSKYIMPFTVGWVLYNPEHSPACVSRTNASVITGVRICRRQLTRFRAEGLQRGTACLLDSEAGRGYVGNAKFHRACSSYARIFIAS